MGFVFSSRSLGYLVGSMVGGPLFDKFDGNKLLAGAITLTAVGPALPRTSSALSALTALSALMNGFFGCYDLS